MKIHVKIPATSANLGPGFDCLGLALDLYNETVFSLEGEGFQIEIEGEGKDRLPKGESNLIVRAFLDLYQRAQIPAPKGVRIAARNAVPISSGMGSSAGAILAGLLGANGLLEEPFSQKEILAVASELEGHPDNVAPALMGGLIVSMQKGEQIFMQKLPIANWDILVVTPDVSWTTTQARDALPTQVSLQDAVFNIGRTNFVTHALATGDLELLGEVMEDRLHQTYRLAGIPGAEASLKSGRERGAAVAISGAGPSLIAFVEKNQFDEVKSGMLKAFSNAGVTAYARHLHPSKTGARKIPA